MDVFNFFGGAYLNFFFMGFNKLKLIAGFAVFVRLKDKLAVQNTLLSAGAFHGLIASAIVDMGFVCICAYQYAVEDRRRLDSYITVVAVLMGDFP